MKVDISPDGTLNISVTPDNAVSDNSSIETNPEPEMTTVQEEEMYEVENGAIAPDVAPVPDANAVSEPEASPENIETTLADMAEKINTILNAVSPGAGTGAEGQVDVIDDETAGAEQNPMPAPAAAPGVPGQDNTVVSEEDMMFEIDEDFMNALSEINNTIRENSEESLSLSEMEEDDEVEVVAEEEGDNEEEEDTVEEMKGVGNAVQRSTSNRKKFKDNNMKHSSINEDVETIKVQYESAIDELTQENESLKEAIEEYKKNITEFSDSFRQLQKQINEMHVFNGKLAYANKLLSKGGLTNGEKIKIAEAFDKAETVEEAKKLYTQFLSEMKSSNSVNTQSKEVKTAKPSVTPAQSTQTETIFESEERKRMRKLAGKIKENNL